MTDFDPSSLFGVRGLVAVISGAGTGLGLMMAQALEANGAIVYILGRRRDVLDKAAGTAKHGNIFPVQADVTSKADLSAAVEHIAQKSGHVNLVVANAGILGPTLQGLGKEVSLAEYQHHLFNSNIDDFNNTYAVNTTGIFYTVVAFLDLLDKGNKAGNVEQKSQVIAISSAGAFSRVPMAGYAYAGSKAAVVHMMKQFATGLAPYGIRSNVIAPGVIPTDLNTDILKQRATEPHPYPKEFIPEERAGNAKDMAGAIIYLTSRAGGYINGNVLVVDGGRLSIIPATY
ncbi:NAD(P)-binding protein [Plenodomus tracheiphilus IPT5]|uniref:NAD(P)-binding protein n=1 Tax=Plenodomus tracheiphilus IPT5 TaxID=1408161 RepID=A0A6A7AQH6_9PLEO|nr:NAD(P)-binding protein [Plenodomus tracheiphilus IPT5]